MRKSRTASLGEGLSTSCAPTTDITIAAPATAATAAKAMSTERTARRSRAGEGAEGMPRWWTAAEQVSSAARLILLAHLSRYVGGRTRKTHPQADDGRAGERQHRPHAPHHRRHDGR